MKFCLDLNFEKILIHDNKRRKISKRLRDLLQKEQQKEYIDLALGLKDPYGNYSAVEHGLGEKILERSSIATVFSLAKKIESVDDSVHMLQLVYTANIPYLKVGVGSEMAMLLKPEVHWVANTRSIWAHLLIKHNSVANANEELSLYRAGSSESEMNYRIWTALHASMKENFLETADAAKKLAEKQGFKILNDNYIWADSIANALYEKYVEKNRW